MKLKRLVKRASTINKTLLKFFALIALTFLCTCSVRLPSNGVKQYQHCQYDLARSTFEKKADPKSKDYLVYRLGTLSTSLNAGDADSSLKIANEALSLMWNLESGKGRGQASLLSAESIKLFKGEPFEKSMAALYAGIIYLNLGDLDNARAAFLKADMAIKKTSESGQNTNQLAMYLLSKLFHQLNEKDNAEIAIKKIKVEHNGYFSKEAIEKDNVIFLFQQGQVPLKVRAGPGGSLVQWMIRGGQPVYKGFVQVDQGPKLYGQEIENLAKLAQLKEWNSKDTIQATKGVLREASVAAAVVAADKASKDKDEVAGWVALGAGVFALLNQSQADVRQWELLPESIQMVSSQMDVGVHQVHIQYPNYTRSMALEIKDPKKLLVFLISPIACNNVVKPIGYTAKE